MIKTSTFCSCENTWGSTVCWLLNTAYVFVIVFSLFCNTCVLSNCCLTNLSKCTIKIVGGKNCLFVHLWLNPLKVWVFYTFGSHPDFIICVIECFQLGANDTSRGIDREVVKKGCSALTCFDKLQRTWIYLCSLFCSYSSDWSSEPSQDSLRSAVGVLLLRCQCKW